MAEYYYDAQAAGSGTGANWTNAFTTFAAALAAATAAGDIIYVASTSVEQLAADTTYTIGNHIAIICVDKSSGTPPTTLQTQEAGGGYLGHLSSSRSIILQGAFRHYMWGMELAVSGGDSIRWVNSDGQHAEYEQCHFRLIGSGGNMQAGLTTNEQNRYVKLKDCKLTFGNANNTVQVGSAFEMEGCVLAGTAPTNCFTLTSRGGNLFRAEGCDLSLITTTLFLPNTTEACEARVTNCKLGSGVTVLSTTGASNKGFTVVWLFDTAVGDDHFHLGYFDPLGQVTVETGIYANDGAQYDGSNRCSWKLVTSGNCSYWTPFVTPWFDRFNDVLSAMTPSIEILRDGSTTPWQDDEVWGEFAFKGTSGSTRSSFVNDRKAILASAADQAAGVGSSGWTGEGGSAWSGKLQPASAITPAEIGHIRGRVCVGEPSITVYVDPQTRLA